MIENAVDVFQSLIDFSLQDVHTVIPGIIDQYYGHSERKAKVKPLVKKVTINNDVINIKPIDNVPVIFPSSSDFNILFSLKKNDSCLILFSETGIGNWKKSNGIIETEPASTDRHVLEGAICLPGLWSFKNIPFTPENDIDFTLSFQDFSLIVTDSTNEVTIKDKEGNIFATSQNGINITDKNGNTINMSSSKVTINENLEVLQ